MTDTYFRTTVLTALQQSYNCGWSDGHVAKSVTSDHTLSHIANGVIEILTASGNGFELLIAQQERIGELDQSYNRLTVQIVGERQRTQKVVDGLVLKMESRIDQLEEELAAAMAQIGRQ